MQLEQIQAIKSKIKDKIQTGDYVTLSKILDVPRDTALARYRRNSKAEVFIMKTIVTEREKLIKKLKIKQHDKIIS